MVVHDLLDGRTMKRILIAGLLMLAATTSIARAERDDSNTLSVQAGLMPALSVLGLEYTRVLHPRFELDASASIGFGIQMALVPRVRWSAGAWRFAAGVGPSVAVLDSSDLEHSTYPQLVAEAAISYVTRRGVAIGLTGGAAGFCDGDESALDCSEVEVAPVGALGVGWMF